METSENKKIKIPIFLPFSAAIVILLTIFIISMHWLQNRHITQQVQETIKGTQTLFNGYLKKDALMMDGMIDFIKKDENLQQAWLAKDRDRLLQYAKPIFEDIRDKYQVTHFYFIGIDGVCLLRVHNLSEYGDKVKRFTMTEAMRQAKPVYGIELGKFGTFTLRVVHPWHINGKLAGYIELGEETYHITPSMKETLGVELRFVIRKSYLNRTQWEEGLKMMGRNGDWNLMTDYVVTDSTLATISQKLIKNIALPHVKYKDFIFESSTGNHNYYNGFVPLLDAGTRKVGDIVVTKEVTKDKVAMKHLTMILIGVCIPVCIGLLVIIKLYIHFIENKVTTAYNDLQNAIEKRELVEEELRQSYSKVEQEVEKRTAELQVANEQLIGEITRRKQTEERINKLNHLQTELLGTGSIAEKSKAITNAVVEIFDADFCRIWLVNKGDLCDSGCIHAKVTEGPHVCCYRDRCLFLTASSGRYTHIDGQVHRRVPFGCYKIGRIAANQDTKFLTNNVSNDSYILNHDWITELGLVSFAGYQLRTSGGEIIGVLALFSKHVISSDEDTLLESTANIASQVVQTCQAEETLLKRSKQIIRYQDTLLKLAKMESNDFAYTLKTIIKEDAETLDAERVSIWFFNEDRSATTCEYLYTLSKKTYENGLSLKAKDYPAYFSSMGETRVLVANNAWTDPHTKEFTETYLKPAGITSIMDAFIRVHDTIVGVARHERIGPMRQWTSEEQEFVASISDLISLKLEVFEHNKTENMLQQSEQKYRSVIENIPDVVWTTTSAGKTIFISPTVKRVYGYTPNEIYDEGDAVFFGRIHPDDIDNVKNAIQALFDKKSLFDIEYRIQRKDGNWIWLHDRTVDTYEKDGLLCADGIFSDITARKEAEEMMKVLNEDLKETIRQLRQANHQLADFANIAAHDLKAPLRAIGTLADWIAIDYADKFDDEGRKKVKLLTGRAERMSKLLDAIMLYCNVSQIAQTSGKVDLNELLTEVIAEIILPPNIDITVENELPTLIRDKKTITYLFSNLLNNAVKYMNKPQGLIRVACSEENNFWKFSVSDNGPGIESKYFEKIFGIFQTLSPRDQCESIGMGLSLVKKIVETYGGNIWVESEWGQGSIFFFTLPKQESEVVEHVQLQTNIAG